MPPNELVTTLSKNNLDADTLKTYLNTSYFKNRHLSLIEGRYED